MVKRPEFYPFPNNNRSNNKKNNHSEKKERNIPNKSGTTLKPNTLETVARTMSNISHGSAGGARLRSAHALSNLQRTSRLFRNIGPPNTARHNFTRRNRSKKALNRELNPNNSENRKVGNAYGVAYTLFSVLNRKSEPSRQEWNRFTRYQKATWLVLKGHLPEMLGVETNNSNEVSGIVIIATDTARVVLEKTDGSYSIIVKVRSSRRHQSHNNNSNTFKELYDYLFRLIDSESNLVSKAGKRVIPQQYPGPSFPINSLRRYIQLLSKISHEWLDAMFLVLRPNIWRRNLQRGTSSV